VIYTLLVENLVVLIPKVGQTIQKWMPFTEATTSWWPVRRPGRGEALRTCRWARGRRWPTSPGSPWDHDNRAVHAQPEGCLTRL